LRKQTSSAVTGRKQGLTRWRHDRRPAPRGNEIRELAERTAEKLKKLTEEEFAELVFLPAEDME
jgi:hypothetical protein